MASQREGPNPLRPYYRPPSVGLSVDPSSKSAAPGLSNRAGASAGRASFGSSARDILSDLDYTDYISDSSPSAADMAKSLLDQALWKYTSVLIAQPFDVAKTILQCYVAAGPEGLSRAAASQGSSRRPDSYRSSIYDEIPSDGSDSDEPSYFTSAAPSSSHRSPNKSRHTSERAGYERASSSSSSVTRQPHKLDLRHSDSLLEVISQLWQKESAWGVWKATNASFIYSLLLKAIESWMRSLLSAVLNVPDPGLLAGTTVGGLDVVDSPYPLASLGVAVAASGLASLILSPLDIVRTRLILTPTTTSSPRALLPSLKSLPDLTIPPPLLPITLLHSCLPTLINTSTPLVLRSRFSIDPVISPTAYSLVTFLSSTLELFVRLPLETVLRRGQMAVPLHDPATGHAVLPETVVDVGEFRGVFGTMWFVAKEEGTRPATAKELKRGRGMGGRKGQGVEGLWRGWRVGMWGLVGVWGAAALGGAGAKGGEF
ncbi:MAG: hypothetical protein M1819_006024 [Sarea resinae]|nr:MAG: hypothetical protein M1819_006024 [Sarea resinae]